MTKIKNTKKGMAKKTLSMSLVVAMLATSNVPVWAAEFSDGSDVAVTSDAEASVAETFSDDVTETPVVEDTTDNTAVATVAEVSSDSFSVTPEFTDNANNAIKDNAVTWGTTVKAKFKVTAKDNKAIDSNIKFHYAWKVNGTADSATDIETPTNEQTVTRATVAAEAGKTLTLFVYATDSNDNNRTVWSYTSEGIAVKAIDVSQVYLSASVDGTHTYNGKPQEIASSDITLTLNDGKQTHETVKANAATVGANFKVVQSGDHTNATKKATVTLVPQADGYTGQISTTYEIEPKTLDGTNDKLISEHMEATLLTSAFTYTGKVIRVKKDDIKLIDKETKEDLSNYIYADKDGYVSISAGSANNLATNVDDVAYARINLIIGTPETGKFKNYNITAEGDNHRTIETTNTFKVTSRDLSDVNVSIKAKTYNDKKKVTIDKNDITFTDKNGNTLDLYKDVVITVPDNATDIGSYKVTITPTSAPDDLKFKWGIDKFNLANANVTVDGDKVTVKCGRVDVETSEYTVEKKDGKVTVTAKKDSKNYTGSKTVDAATQDQKPAAPMISSVKVVGNKATAILSGDSEGAAGYDYVISTDRDCITNKDYDSVNKNQVQTSTTFKYVQQGTYYAYCHAWKRDENGKKVFSDWSNAYPFVVSAITPDAPVITNVKVSGSTIKVTYKAAANATGYDVVLGTDSKKENGETRPYHYGNHKVLNLKEGTVTATFKKVPKGTWVVGMHAFNRTSEDGKKVFSPWSNLKKATVK